ncbi:MAG: hypothetical protein FWE54_06830 [Methanimicrococcus sp.]|nr:hypothetical protein [Methanimicrococcus sp.]
MDLERFIKKAGRIIRRNRTVYDFLEAMAIALAMLLGSVYFNLNELFKHFSITEPYVGLQPNIPLLEVNYETIFTFSIAVFLALLLMELYSYYRKAVYRKRNKALPKREKPADIVERSYPGLKDRLKTAYDTRADDTIIAADLNKSVSRDVHSVTAAGMLDLKRLTFSAAAIVVCGMLLATVAFTGITSPYTPDDVFDRFPNGTITLPPLTPEEPEGNNSSSPPTMTPPISTAPGIDIDITLPPGTGAGPGDLLENNTNNTYHPSQYYPPESLSSTHYYEFLPEGYEDIIKDYFKRLAEQS